MITAYDRLIRKKKEKEKRKEKKNLFEKFDALEKYCDIFRTGFSRYSFVQFVIIPNLI